MVGYEIFFDDVKLSSALVPRIKNDHSLILSLLTSMKLTYAWQYSISSKGGLINSFVQKGGLNREFTVLLSWSVVQPACHSSSYSVSHSARSSMLSPANHLVGQSAKQLANPRANHPYQFGSQ